MPLRDVLDTFEQAGSLSLSQLAKRLDVEQNTLEGMIQFWINKGKLREVHRHDCSSCGVQQKCPLLVTQPRRYELVTDDLPPTEESLPCQSRLTLRG